MNSDVVEQFEQYLRYAGKSDRTVYNYCRFVRQFLQFIGNDVDNVNKRTIVEFYNYLKSKRGYTDRSIAAVGWAIKAFLEFIDRSDIARWVPTPSYTVIREPKWLPEEIVMKVIKGEPVLEVAYDLALRLGEVLLLRRSGYNPNTGEIEVIRLKKKGRFNRQILKLTDWVNQDLREYVARNPTKDDRLFLIPRRTIVYIFKKRIKEAGLDPREYTFHCLRHSRATNIAIKEIREKGYVDVMRLAKFLGHSRVETTMIYVHLASKYLSFHQHKSD